MGTPRSNGLLDGKAERVYSAYRGHLLGQDIATGPGDAVPTRESEVWRSTGESTHVPSSPNLDDIPVTRGVHGVHGVLDDGEVTGAVLLYILSPAMSRTCAGEPEHENRKANRVLPATHDRTSSVKPFQVQRINVIFWIRTSPPVRVTLCRPAFIVPSTRRITRRPRRS